MEKCKVEIGGYKFNCHKLVSEEDCKTGLQIYNSLPKNSCMFFPKSDEEERMCMAMKSVSFPIDIIFF